MQMIRGKSVATPVGQAIFRQICADCELLLPQPGARKVKGTAGDAAGGQLRPHTSCDAGDCVRMRMVLEAGGDCVGEEAAE